MTWRWLYLFSQVYLISQNCPQNISNRNIPSDNSSAQHLLLEAKAQLSAHHQFSKLFHYKHNTCKVGPTILEFLTYSLSEGERYFRKLCLLFPLLEPAAGVPTKGGEIKAQTPLASLICLGVCLGMCTTLY